MGLWVYMLRCSDDSLYVGVTNSIERRMREHTTGANPTSYTFSRRPVELVYHEKYFFNLEAIAREKQLKNWSHAKKEALIAGDFKKLKTLSTCRNETVFTNKPVLDSARDDDDVNQSN